MSEDAHRASEGLIGPNAILQLLPVVDRESGLGGSARLLSAAGIGDLPDGHAMIPERDAVRLHRQLRLAFPAQAPRLAAEAGRRTADYILAHRIPKPAQRGLKALPKGMAARVLSRAITKHAWTFSGSGQFRALDPWTFELEENPFILGETSETCLCHWHAAVFARLYQALVSPACRCQEVQCGAQIGARTCRFKMYAHRPGPMD